MNTNNPITGFKDALIRGGVSADKAAKIEEVMLMPEVQFGITQTAKKFAWSGLKLGFILGILITALVVMVAKYAV